jgi:hypothetical protein
MFKTDDKNCHQIYNQEKSGLLLRVNSRTEREDNLSRLIFYFRQNNVTKVVYLLKYCLNHRVRGQYTEWRDGHSHLTRSHISIASLIKLGPFSLRLLGKDRRTYTDGHGNTGSLPFLKTHSVLKIGILLFLICSLKFLAFH